MQVYACEKVSVIVQAAVRFLVLILKALQWRLFFLNLGACDGANFLDLAR